MVEKSASNKSQIPKLLKPWQRLLGAVLIYGVVLLSILARRLPPGKLTLQTGIDPYIPLWPQWALFYLLVFVWWAAAVIWAARRMDSRRFKAFVLSMLVANFSAYVFHWLAPVAAIQTEVIGSRWSNNLVGFIIQNPLPATRLPSSLVIVTAIIAVFWWHWRPRFRWVWFSTVPLAMLAALFVKQNYLLETMSGLLWAFCIYFITAKLLGWQPRKITFTLDDWAKFGFRVFWLWTILYMSIMAVTYDSIPSDGVTGDLTSFTAEGYQVVWVIDERPGGLREGDVVVQVEGYDIEQWLAGDVEPSDTWKTGGQVRYDLLRPEGLETYWIELQPLAFGTIARHWGLQFVGIIVITFIGSLIFWMRPDYSAAQWFMVFCLMIAAQMVGDGWNFQIALLARPFIFWLHLINEQISFPMIHAAALIQAFTFPREFEFMKKAGRWVVAVVILAVLVPTLGALKFFSPLGAALDISNRVSIVGSGIYLVAAVIIAFRRLGQLSEPADREKLKWWMFIGIMYEMILLPFYYLPLVTLGQPFIPPNVASALALIGLPLALSIAMLNVRLYGIDFLINRSLVYGLLTYGLVGTFGLTLFGINQLTTTLTGGEQSVIAVAISAAIFGALFRPLRRRLQRFVDQRFYRINIDYERVAKMRKELDGIVIDIKQDIQISPFEDLEYLGSGGMAVTYKGYHPGIEQTVAIKVLPAHLLEEPYYQVRFEREANMLSMLDHDNIVHLIDFGVEGEFPYMVMEYVEGVTLSYHILLNGPFTVERALPVISDIAGALDYAHQKHLVHRDVKPSNIILDPLIETGQPEFRAVLMDFGVAKLVSGEETHVTFNEVVGSFDYIAPEQIEESRSVSRRADIYSLGMVVFKMVTGKLPYEADHPGAQLMAHLRQEPIDPRHFVPSLPDAFTESILRAIKKDPAKRFASAGEFFESLKA
ncbi:protein kinase [Chloroflexota bacterium]